METITLNKKIGRWTVIAGPFFTDPNHPKWTCQCECGTVKLVRDDLLQNGGSTSCGCSRWGRQAESHGQSKTPLYRVWDTMWARCNNPKNQRYKNYGARGIKVCDEWVLFSTFATWAKSSGYEDGLTIERRDNDGNYTPENCTWIPKRQQRRNTQKTIRITAWGETKSLPEWIEDPRCGAKYHTVYARLQKGMAPEDALK